MHKDSGENFEIDPGTEPSDSSDKIPDTATGTVVVNCQPANANALTIEPCYFLLEFPMVRHKYYLYIIYYMDTSVKSTLISFYYLLEIIKLRIVSYNIDNNLKEANNIIKKYNNIIKPYISLYNKNMKEQEKKAKSINIKPLKNRL